MLALFGNAAVLNEKRPVDDTKQSLSLSLSLSVTGAALPAVTLPRGSLVSKSLPLRRPAHSPAVRTGRPVVTASPSSRFGDDEPFDVQRRLAARRAIAPRVAPPQEAPAARDPHPPPGAHEATDETELVVERMRALRRIRERRDSALRVEDDRRRREEESRVPMLQKEQQAKEAAEQRDRLRAEVYAINRLFAARDELAFGEYMAGREEELEAVLAAHEVEMEARRQEQNAADRVCQQRLRALDKEARAERKRAKAEAAEREGRRESRREEARAKEEEREATRAQIYAINALMRSAEEARFAQFVAARGGLPPPSELDGSAGGGGEVGTGG